MLRKSDYKLAITHLKTVDTVLGSIIDVKGELTFFNPAATPYESIGRSIIGQQLSTKAATAIHKKVATQFGSYDDSTGIATLPKPEELISLTEEKLHSAGLSRQKIITLKEIANYSIAGNLNQEILEKSEDEKIIEALTKITGIGRWTAQMFLMNYLQRPDILPIGDLGIRKAIQKNYGLLSLPTEKNVLLIGKHWHPWSTIASRYLWLSLE